MIKYKRNHRGVSLITLVVTIMVIIILAGVTINYGLNQNIDKTSETLNINEIFDVSESVAQRSLMNRLDSSRYALVGTPLTTSKTVNKVTYGDGWYELNSSNYSELSLENIKGKYLINYDTGEVVSLSPIYYQNKEYYTASSIKEALGNSGATE